MPPKTPQFGGQLWGAATSAGYNRRMPPETTANTDPEFDAITAIVRALEPLDEEARARVLDYSLRRLGLARPFTPVGDTGSSGGAIQSAASGPTTIHDIRTLREEKQPKSANEMAALVGYYLVHLAPEADRKAEINAADVTKYFHDANYPIPGNASMTLVHARNAGYFDAGDRGSYRLNPVGHNLVAHRLPAAAASARQRRVRPSIRKPGRAAKSTASKGGSKARKSR